MSNFSAIIPVADMAAINDRLAEEGFGPGNFSVPCNTTGDIATHAALHCWSIPDFRAVLEAAQADFPNLKIVDGNGEPNLAEALAAENLTAWKQPEGAHDAKMKGSRVTVSGKTWESLIDYNVWPPGVSGWREIVAVGYPAWVQPTGAHDAYAKGARVSFQGSDYESKIAANVWSPAVYPAGWTKL